MRNIIYIGGKQFMFDCGTRQTHAVVAALRETPPEVVDKDKPTPEEQIEIRRFTFEKLHGKFAHKVQVWTTSEAEANERLKEFQSHDWSFAKVVLVDKVIDYA